MTETTPEPEAPEASAPDADDELVRAVTACQLVRCTQVVPEAMEIRVAAAREARDAGVRWFRTAGAHDPKVLELEAPFRRDAAAPPEKPKKRAAKKAAPKSSGSRGRRSTKKEGK